MDVMVVGSLAYDSIQTPAAQGERLLGGSATYAGLASAANDASCGLVGVVGEDFRDEDRALLASAGLHLDGVVTAEGRTFHWEGEYSGAMGEASTLNTELNVFEAFDPEVPQHGPHRACCSAPTSIPRFRARSWISAHPLGCACWIR